MRRVLKTAVGSTYNFGDNQPIAVVISYYCFCTLIDVHDACEKGIMFGERDEKMLRYNVRKTIELCDKALLSAPKMLDTLAIVAVAPCISPATQEELQALLTAASFTEADFDNARAAMRDGIEGSEAEEIWAFSSFCCCFRLTQ